MFFSQYVSWICISQCSDFSWPSQIVLYTVECMAERPMSFEYNNVYSFRLREGMILPSICMETSDEWAMCIPEKNQTGIGGRGVEDMKFPGY